MTTQRRFTLPADPPQRRSGSVVARDHERATLAEHLGASAASGRSVVVGGDAGSGKTALLDAFLAVAQRTGAVVVSGSCVEIESRRPFGPFADVLGACSRIFGPERIDRALKERGVELRRLMARDPSVSLGGSARDRHLMHGSFLGLMEELTAEGPLVLAMEDLHWADEASLELWGYLSRRMRTRPFLLVATYRTDELGRLHPLRILLAQLLTARAVHAVPLGPLDLDGTGALIRMRLGLHDGSAVDLRRFRELVHEKCEGNPLHTEETLDTLQRSGRLAYLDGAWTCDIDDVTTAIPPTIADSVVARWAALSTTAQQALLTASVAGHRFDLELVSAISGEPPAKVAAAIREAIDARLVLPEDEGDDDHLSFRHALTREAIRRQLLHWERRELHGKIAAFLVRRRLTATVMPSELAYHFDESGQSESASRYHEEAAEDAAGALAFASAARHLERAIELGSDERADRARQHVRLSQHLYLSGETARSVRAASIAIDRAERSGDRAILGEGLEQMRRYHHWRGEREYRDQMTTRALQVLEPLGPTPQLVRVLSGRCWAAVESGHGTEVVTLAERALAICDSLGLVAERAMALNSLGTGLYLLGRFDESVAPVRSALAIARQAGLVDEAFWPMGFLRVALCATNAPLVEQQRLRDEQRAFMRQHGLAMQFFISLELTELFSDGDWDGFIRLLPEMEEEAHPARFAEKQVVLAFVKIARSGPEAVPELEKAREGVHAEVLSGDSAFWCTAALLLAGRAEEAVRFAEGVHEDAVHLRLTHLVPAARAHAIGLFAAQRTDDQQALDLFERSLLETNSPPALPVADEIHHALAKASRAERGGAIGDAIRAYRAAVEGCERERYLSAMIPYLVTLTRLRAAERQLSGQVPDKSGAQAELDAVLPFWRQAKATWYLAQLRDWALDHDLDFPRDVSADVAVAGRKTLTQREREVALLVAQGLTNREIAKRLSLSVRTAESHVEQIRSKLGFHTRSQIATWATERARTN